jgi:regulator of protease activity HflC (stomatin/prohibitin superfamily)
MGRFARSQEGVPTLIPQRVLNKFPLPRDAVIVDSDYVPPFQREPEDDIGVGMTAAQIEAEIQRRVAAQVANAEAKARGAKNQKTADASDKAAEKAEKKEAEGEDILDKSIEEITPLLVEMSVEALEDLLEREKAGKTRKGLVIAIEAELEDAKAEAAAKE